MNKLLNFLKEDTWSGQSESAYIANLRVYDMDLRDDPDHEIFLTLLELPHVLDYYLIPGSWNAIKVRTDFDLLDSTADFTEHVLEPLRQLGYDIRLTHLG